MSQPRNILFIMCDQLRWDYLSCYGHPHLHTPHIDSLAARGVRFDRAYCQSPLCAPSRASIYTGRYMSSIGVQWNLQPLGLQYWTMGDYLRPFGYKTAVVGKTHTTADHENMARLGIDPDSVRGQRLANAGFDPFERDDGLHPDGLVAASPAHQNLRYNRYLQEQGYDHPNPWDYHANGTVDDNGNFGSGWYMRHNHKPANIAAEHSETPYMTARAMDCIVAMGDTPWCVHLSFIKPHWPYQAPAPYHDLYGKADMLPRQAATSELENSHPVYKAFAEIQGSRHFARDEVRDNVVPAYMGLVKQIDDEIGRLLTWLAETGRQENTIIVFTSDHGDYLGDHWLYEKDLFHEPSVRIPLIIYDPSSEADGSRGRVVNHFVEGIDLAATFLDWAGGEPQPHKLEGRSLRPFLRSETPSNWRTAAISEIDYSGREPRYSLGRQPADCRGYMIRDDRWKYILWEGFAPQLFDMVNDPQEFVDLGCDPAFAAVRQTYHEQLFAWLRQRKMRMGMSEAAAAQLGPEMEMDIGILIGYWSEEENP